MVITREIDYAFRAIRALSGGSRLNTKAICQKENIPMDFTYKILKKLSQSGIVSIERGVAGGYILTADLARITLYDVIKAVDEPLLLSVCMDCHYSCPNNTGEKNCMIHEELCRVQQAVVEELKRKSFAEIFGMCGCLDESCPAKRDNECEVV